jgi:hypothetical protein
MKLKEEEERGPLKKRVKFGEGDDKKDKKKRSAPSSSANERLIKQWRGMDSQEELRNKLKINDSIAALVGVVGTMVAIIENDILFSETEKKPRYVQNNVCKALRAVQTVTSLLLSKSYQLLLFSRFYH